jgi:hypothetical protein
MMGQQARGESLFYYFRLEDQVPENHLLRLIDRHVNFEFIRAKLKDRYSDAGRPSIDIPNCCYACCWSAISTVWRAKGNWWKSHACIWRGVGSPDWASIKRFPTTLRFPRTRRFQESTLFQELSEEIVVCCVAAGSF